MAVEFEENKEERTCVCKSDKFNATFTISYLRGSALPYEFNQSHGSLNPLLLGRYTTLEKAKEAFLEFDRLSAPSKRKVVTERYAPKQTDQDSQYVHQGIGD